MLLRGFLSCLATTCFRSLDLQQFCPLFVFILSLTFFLFFLLFIFYKVLVCRLSVKVLNGFNMYVARVFFVLAPFVAIYVCYSCVVMWSCFQSESVFFYVVMYCVNRSQLMSCCLVENSSRHETKYPRFVKFSLLLRF